MNNLLLHKLISIIFFASLGLSVCSQTTYKYMLASDFEAADTNAPLLIQMPNNYAETGEFVIREVPASTCSQTGDAMGYFFEDDAGLQFNNPSDFIDQSYSISFIFQLDEFIAPPSWVRLVSFTHIDDVGVYIALTNPPENGTLEFWPHGMVGEGNFFSTNNFYQLVLVRNAVGLIKIYVNGIEFDEYDDSQTQAYVPQDPDNFIIWFRDHPAILANESSPGFVSNIVLSNYPWSAEEVNSKWEAFCSELLIIDEQEISDCKLFPTPSNNYVNISVASGIISEIEIIDVFGKTVLINKPANSMVRLNISSLSAAVYFVRIKTGDNHIIIKTFCKN